MQPTDSYTLQLNLSISQDAIAGFTSQLCQLYQAKPELILEIHITVLMYHLGIPSHIVGYTYLKDALLITSVNDSAINSVTKYLYPEIAKRNGTTAIGVERAIRHAINIVFSKGNQELLHFLFGSSQDSAGKKPTNSEFIARLANCIRIKRAC